MNPSKLSFMVGGLQPTGLADFVAVAHPVGVYSLNNNLGTPSYEWVYRIQDDVWGRLPDACQTDRYFERENPEASAEYELLTKTKYVAKLGNLRLVDMWKLTTANWCAPYNEWVLGDASSDGIAKAQWMNRWNVRALEIAEDNGIDLCIGSFATGGPDIRLLPYLYDMFRLGKSLGAIYDCHEYGVEDALRTSPRSGALYYRNVYSALPEDCRLDIVISEFWWGNGVEPSTSWDLQLDDAMWYGSEIVKDHYVKWASAFQLNSGGENNMPLEMVHEYAQRAAELAQIDPEPPPIEPSFDGDMAAQVVIIDPDNVEWSLGDERFEAGYRVLRNGEQWAEGFAVAILLHAENIYVTNAFAQWFRVTLDGYEEIPNDPRLGVPPVPVPFWVSWPVEAVESPRVTDSFNAPRTYANGKHEGIDIDAYVNSQSRNAKVLAAQDGIVEYVRHRTDPSYGLHVVIRHPWGTDESRYRTLYGHLSSISVAQGQTVKRGDVIGVSGATGTTAIHLHFNVHDSVAGLKGYVRCSDCSGLWGDGVVDPFPLIRFDSQPPQPPTTGTVSLRSVHGRADGGSLRAVDLKAAKTSPMINAYKLFKGAREDYGMLIANGIPASNILVRFDHVRDRRVAASAYVNGSTGFYDLPIKESLADGTPKYVEIFNEPNLVSEGYGVAWTSIDDFTILCNGVISLIRQYYPTVKILSPAISPQPDTQTWWEKFSQNGIFAACNGYAAHSYWDGRTYPMDSPSGGRHYRGLLPFLTGTKQIFITEASNNRNFDSDVQKGEQYAQYLKTMETQVARVDFFCISSSNTGDGSLFNSNRETWVLPNDSISAIPSNVK